MSVAPLVLSAANHARAVLSPVPPIAVALGWLAGVIGIGTGWPQAWRLWAGRRHEGLSLTANVLGVLYSTAWLLYGVAKHSGVQVATSILGLVGLVSILAGHLALARPTLRRWLPLLLSGLAVLFAVSAAGPRTLGLTASAATISGVLPQAVSLARARRAGACDASGVSRTRWALSSVANLLWVSYGLIVGDPVIIGNSAVIAGLGAAIVALASSARTAPAHELARDVELAIAA